MPKYLPSTWNALSDASPNVSPHSVPGSITSVRSAARPPSMKFCAQLPAQVK
jgi:hypothetical protein